MARIVEKASARDVKQVSRPTRRPQDPSHSNSDTLAEAELDSGALDTPTLAAAGLTNGDPEEAAGSITVSGEIPEGQTVGELVGVGYRLPLVAGPSLMSFAEPAEAQAFARTAGTATVLLEGEDGFIEVHAITCSDALSVGLGIVEAAARNLVSPGSMPVADTTWSLDRQDVAGGTAWGLDAVRMTGVPGVLGFTTDDGFLVTPGHDVSKAFHDTPPELTAGDHDASQAPLREVYGEGLVDAEGDAGFLLAFEDGLRTTVLQLLLDAELEAQRTQSAMNAGSEADLDAVQDALDKVLPVDAQLAQVDHELGMAETASHMHPTGGNVDLAMGESLSGKDVESLTLQRDALVSLRNDILAPVPVLTRVDRKALAALPDDQRAGLLANTCGDVLDGIGRSREALLGGRLDVWSLAPAVRPTLASLRVTDPEKVALVEARVFQGQLEDTLWQVTMAALAIGLGVAAAVTTGPLGVGLTLAAAGTGLADAIMQTDEYALASATSRSDLDANESLTHPDELQNAELMLAIAWISIGLDVADAMKLASTVGRLGRTVSLMDALAESGVQTRIPAEALEAAARRSRGAVLLGEEGAGALDEGVEGARAVEAAEELGSAAGPRGSAGALGALSEDPAYADLVDAAERSARAHDLGEMRRLHQAIEERGADRVTLDALWDDLNDLLRSSPLEQVRMADEVHHLRLGVEGGRPVVLLCSDCAALGKTLAWLKTHEKVTSEPDLARLVDDLTAQLAQAESALAQDQVRGMDAIRESLEAIGREHDVPCLTCLADAGVAGETAEFEHALPLVGRPLDEVRTDPGFTDAYVVKRTNGKTYISRKEGRPAAGFPELGVDADGRLVFKANARRRIPLRTDRPAADVLESLMTPGEDTYAESLHQLHAALVQSGELDAARLESLAADALVGLPSESTVDATRHAIKVAWKDVLLGQVVSANVSARASVLRMRAVVESINTSDQGNLVEAWLMRWRTQYQEVDPDRLRRHAKLLKDGNEGMTESRDVDLVQIIEESNGLLRMEGNEVKSGLTLSQRDMEQTTDVLEAIKRQRNRDPSAPSGAHATIGAKPNQQAGVIETHTLTVMDWRMLEDPAAQDALDLWFTRYPEFFILEYFDESGARHVMDAKDWLMRPAAR